MSKKHKVARAVNWANFANKANTAGQRRQPPGSSKKTLLAELTAVDESESPWHYSYREVEWDGEQSRYQIKDGGEEGEEALPLPFPTPFCCIGDVVEIQVDDEDNKTFEYPGKYAANVRRLSMAGKGALAWAFDGGFVVSKEDLDADEPEPVKVFLQVHRVKDHEWFGISPNPFSDQNTTVHNSDVDADDRKVYVFNTLNTSFAGGNCKVIWGESCWQIVLRTCGDD